MPETIESQHMGHPDFRVNGKVFSTLFERDGIDFAMVRVPADLQQSLITAHPDVFEPLTGAWGRQGCTRIALPAVKRMHGPVIRGAVLAAWRKSAPKRLVEREFGES